MTNHPEKIPHRSWPIIEKEERLAISRVLDRGILSGSFAPESVAFEAEFAEFIGVRYCLLTHSGTSALQIALAAAGIGAGDEVIVPAYSFVATPLAVLLVGATPVFVDINIKTGCIDPVLISSAITSRTRAIMPVHIHGQATEMKELQKIADTYKLMIIEDAAQAHGAMYHGKTVGGFGVASGFSLQSSKNLAAGEGGIFVTNDGAIAQLANQLRNFGQDIALHQTYNPEHPLDSNRILHSERMGAMYRGNEMMAAFARAQLKKLPRRTLRCQQNAARLSAALAQLPGVIPPAIYIDKMSVFHKFCIRLDPTLAGVSLPVREFRNLIMNALKTEGMEVALWQDVPLPMHPLFKPKNDTIKNFPVTQQFLDSTMMLFSQSYPLIAQEDEMIDKYIEIFRCIWEKFRRSIKEFYCSKTLKK